MKDHYIACPLCGVTRNSLTMPDCLICIEQKELKASGKRYKNKNDSPRGADRLRKK